MLLEPGSHLQDILPDRREPPLNYRVHLKVEWHRARILESFEGLIRIYHNDTPCPHLLSRIGLLPFEVWNFSHEMDIAAVREAVGPELVLLGNVSPLDTLARGTAEQVYEEARACVAKAAPGGGFILSAGGGASPGTPAENIDALVRAARED